VVLATDGSASVRLSTTGPLADAEMLGRKLAAEMLAEGPHLLEQSGLMREERS
jgi:hydroxymethylbilane synthase